MNLDEACDNFKKEFNHYMQKEEILKHYQGKHVMIRYNEVKNEYGFMTKKPELVIRYN